MSLTTAFEVGLIRPVIQGITDVLAAGISVNIIPETREPFVNLPGLRGYWPMSVVDFLGNAKDHSGASSDLARVGSPQFGHGSGSYIQCSPVGNYLAGSISAQAVTGTETWIEPAIRGVTVGAWIRADSSPVSLGGLLGRWSGTPQKSFSLLWASADTVSFLVSGDGLVSITVVGSVQPLVTWLFIVGRFTPSTEVALFVNDVKVTNTTSIPAALFGGTSVFEVGRVNANNSNVLAGRFRDAFLTASALTDVEIENLRLSSLPAT